MTTPAVYYPADQHPGSPFDAIRRTKREQAWLNDHHTEGPRS